MLMSACGRYVKYTGRQGIHRQGGVSTLNTLYTLYTLSTLSTLSTLFTCYPYISKQRIKP